MARGHLTRGRLSHSAAHPPKPRTPGPLSGQATTCIPCFPSEPCALEKHPEPPGSSASFGDPTVPPGASLRGLRGTSLHHHSLRTPPLPAPLWAPAARQLEGHIPAPGSPSSWQQVGGKAEWDWRRWRKCPLTPGLARASRGPSALTLGLIEHDLQPEWMSPLCVSPLHSCAPQLWSRQTWLQVLVLPPINCVDLDKILHLSLRLVQSVGKISTSTPWGSLRGNRHPAGNI